MKPRALSCWWAGCWWISADETGGDSRLRLGWDDVHGNDWIGDAWSRGPTSVRSLSEPHRRMILGPSREHLSLPMTRCRRAGSGNRAVSGAAQMTDCLFAPIDVASRAQKPGRYLTEAGVSVVDGGRQPKRVRRRSQNRELHAPPKCRSDDFVTPRRDNSGTITTVYQIERGDSARRARAARPWQTHRVSGAALLLMAACSGASRPAVLDAVATAKGASSAEPAKADTSPTRSRLVTIRHASADLSLVSPADDRLVREVEVTSVGRALLVDALASPTDGPRLLGRGMTVSEVRFIDNAHLIAYDARAGVAALLALDTGAEARFACRVRPNTSADGAHLATIDPGGHFTELDPGTLAVRWVLATPVVPATALDIELRPVGEAGFVVAYDTGGIVVDLATRAVRFAGTAAPPIVSPSGRHVAEVAPRSSDVGAPDWWISVTDVTRDAIVFTAETPGALGAIVPPPIAFARNERWAAYSFEASMITLVDLTSGRAQTVRTGLADRGDVAEYFTDHLAFSADGRSVCGHVASTLGSETTCGGRIYAEIKAARAQPGRGDCVLETDFAVRVPPASKIERGGRRMLIDAHSPSVSVCGRALAPDRRLLAVATAREQVQDSVLLWTDAELSLFDLERGEVMRRLPLGAAGANEFSAEFSPAGRWLAVEFGFRSLVFETSTGRSLDSFAAWPAEASASETLGLRREPDGLAVVSLSDGTARRFPNAVGTFCLESSRLMPPERCVAAKRESAHGQPDAAAGPR